MSAIRNEGFSAPSINNAIASLLQKIDGLTSDGYCELMTELLRRGPRQGYKISLRRQRMHRDMHVILETIHGEFAMAKRKSWKSLWARFDRVEPEFHKWCKNPEVLRTSYARLLCRSRGSSPAQ